MKKPFLKSLLLSLMMFAWMPLTSGAQAISLDFVAERLNKNCPVSITREASLTKATFHPHQVEFQIEVEEPDFDLDLMSQNSDYWKTLLLDQYEKSSEETQQLLSVLAEHDIALTVVCVGKNSGKRATCRVNPHELKTIQGEEDESIQNTRLLENTVMAVNNACPIFVFDGVRISDMSIDGFNVMLSLTIDERVHKIEGMRQRSGTIRNYLMDAVRSHEAMRLFATLCARNGMGIVFQLSGSETGTFADVALSADNLRASLGE